MDVTVVKSGYSIKQIFIGKPTEVLKESVKQLNDNPLVEEEYTIEQCYSNKSIYELADFLGIS